jgi:hypothetical protein
MRKYLLTAVLVAAFASPALAGQVYVAYDGKRVINSSLASSRSVIRPSYSAASTRGARSHEISSMRSRSLTEFDFSRQPQPGLLKRGEVISHF